MSSDYQGGVMDVSITPEDRRAREAAIERRKNSAKSRSNRATEHDEKCVKRLLRKNIRHINRSIHKMVKAERSAYRRGRPLRRQRELTLQTVHRGVVYAMCSEEIERYIGEAVAKYHGVEYSVYHGYSERTQRGNTITVRVALNLQEA